MIKKCIKCGSPRLRAEAVQLPEGRVIAYSCLQCYGRFTLMEPAPPRLKLKVPLEEICRKRGLLLKE